MNDMQGMNITVLIGIAVGIFAAVAIILTMVKFLKKDNALVTIDKLLKAGNYKKALNTALPYLKEHPMDFMIRYYIGQAYEGLADPVNAIAYYEKASVAMAENESSALRNQVLLKIADLFKKKRNLKEAMGYYAMILDKDPHNMRALYPLSEILFEQGNFKKAKQYLDTIVKLKPDNLKARFLLAKVSVKVNLLQDAAAQLKSVVQSAKPAEEELKNSAVLFLADIYLSMKNFREAIQLLKPLLDNKQYFEDVLIKIVDSLIKINELKQAIELANRNSGRINKLKEAQIYYLIATAYFKDGEVYKAVKNWEISFKSNPSFRDNKDIVQKYAPIINNPKMEMYFTNNLTFFENLCLEMLKNSYVKQIIKKESFWILETSDNNYAMYRLAHPLSKIELADIDDLISRQFHASSQYLIYSLFGTSAEAKEQLDKLNKARVIEGDEFVKAVNGN
jgi:tetratricopeptide (TPR) repeat protein